MFFLLLLHSPSPTETYPTSRGLAPDQTSVATFKKCERQLGSVFTKAEKTEICTHGTTSAKTSPLYSACALEVRKEFKMTLADISVFCENIASFTQLRLGTLRSNSLN